MRLFQLISVVSFFVHVHICHSHKKKVRKLAATARSFEMFGHVEIYWLALLFLFTDALVRC